MVADLREEVRRRQAARLERKATAGKAPRGRPSPWAHVPLAELFREVGNVVHETGDDRVLETGHQPFHGSKSGRSVRIDARLGLWYCRGCRRGGDALTFWIAKSGLNRRKAYAELAERFGPPARLARRRRKSLVLEVVVP